MCTLGSLAGLHANCRLFFLIGDSGIMEGFKIRSVTCVQELSYALQLAAAEGWRPGVGDAESFYAADSTGFFIGELNGRKIGTVSAVKYDSRLSFGGFLIVENAYRGQGYGLALLNAGIASCGQRNIALDSVAEYSDLYNRHGFKKVWTNRRFELDPLVALPIMELEPSPPNVTVKSTAEIDFSQLAEYDAVMFGVSRHSFLTKWIAGSQSKGFAAVSSAGELLGYIVIRKTMVDGEGYKIGPLFADTLDTARMLLMNALKVASSTTDDRLVYIDVPIDLNPNAVKLVEELKGSAGFTTHRMYSKGMPDIPGTKIYGVTSLELG